MSDRTPSSTDTPRTSTRLLGHARLAALTSRVAERTLFEGAFSGTQPDLGLRIDGALQGSIRLGAGSTVHIGPAGVAPDTLIEADHVLIEGQVSGTIVARRLLEVGASAQVRGELVYGGQLDVHPGARLRCRIEYRQPIDPPAP